MPRRPKRPCGYPGCPELTDGSYCEKHQKEVYSHYNKYRRNPESKRRYGRAWKRIRDRYIAKEPFCELCKANGRMVLAEEVHHIKPLSEINEEYEVDPINDLIPVCPNCHAMLHRQQNGIPMTVERLKLLYEVSRNSKI